MATKPAYGYEEAVGLVQEASYGAGGTPNIWFRPVSCTLARKDPPLQLSGPTGAAVGWRYSSVLPRHFKGTPDVSGTIVFEAEYDDIGWLLANAFEDADTTNDSPVAGADSHEFTLAATHASTMPTSLCIAVLNGTENLEFNGCMIDNLEISGSAGRIVTVSCDFIGQSGGDGTVANTFGTISAVPFIEFQDSALEYHTTPSTARGSLVTETDDGKEPLDWSFRLENGLRAVEAAGDGVRGIRQPIYGGYRRAMLTVNRDLINTDFFDKMQSSTLVGQYASFALKCTSDEFITGSTPYSLDLHIPAGIVVGDPFEYGGGADVIPETVTIEAAYDGTNAPVIVTLVNATNSY